MRRFALVSLLFLATACKEVKTPGGHVPADFLGQAHLAVGSYSGSFAGVPTTLVLRLDGDQPRVEVRNAQNNDLLGPHCGSTVGLLNTVDVDEVSSGKYVLRRAYFTFAGNRCPVEGGDLELDVAEDGRTLSASVLKSTDIDPCLVEASAPVARDPGDIGDHCHSHPTRNYLTGSFRR
jgi:hypothetical protein